MPLCNLFYSETISHVQYRNLFCCASIKKAFLRSYQDVVEYKQSCVLIYYLTKPLQVLNYPLKYLLSEYDVLLYYSIYYSNEFINLNYIIENRIFIIIKLI